MYGEEGAESGGVPPRRLVSDHLSRLLWGVVIGLGTYMIVASAIAVVVGWFN